MTQPNTPSLHSLDLPFPLRSYQEDGVSFLTGSASALLADEMGPGKTVQTIVALRILYMSGELKRTLIITPRALRLNWAHEFAVWAPNLPVRLVEGAAGNRLAMYTLNHPVLLATYEQIRQDIDKFPAKMFSLVLLDEAQCLENRLGFSLQLFE